MIIKLRDRKYSIATETDTELMLIMVDDDLNPISGPKYIPKEQIVKIMEEDARNKMEDNSYLSIYDY